MADPSDLLTFTLTAAQRKLLLGYESFFADQDLFRLISIAMKKGRNYEIHLTGEQYFALLDQLDELYDREDNEKKQDKLDQLYEVLRIEDSSSFPDTDVSANEGAVCVLKVALAEQKKIWRKIAIREGQTLHDLHEIIFSAFARFDEHMYTFFFPSLPTKFDPRQLFRQARQISHPFLCEEDGLNPEQHSGALVSIGTMQLKPQQVFYYLFDFGDEWWHEITVEAVGGTADQGDYPRILEKKGASPSQYPDSGDDEEVGIDDFEEQQEEDS